MSFPGHTLQWRGENKVHVPKHVIQLSRHGKKHRDVSKYQREKKDGEHQSMCRDKKMKSKKRGGGGERGGGEKRRGGKERGGKRAAGGRGGEKERGGKEKGGESRVLWY